MKNANEVSMDTWKSEFGKLIANLRNRCGMTQDELAERVNHYLGDKKINRNTISRIENGTFDPHLTTFLGIVKTLHVTPNDICPKGLLEDTTLERYSELNAKSRKQLRGMIDILIEGQNDSAK